MNLTKDRYSHAMLLALAGLAAAIFFLRAGKGAWAAACFLGGGLYFAWLLTRPGRVHLTDEQKAGINNPGGSLPPGTATLLPVRSHIKLKGETDCGFSATAKRDIDGIQIGATRYKAVNGTDVYIDGQFVRPCGPGSAIMQELGGGGQEPAGIQSDPCWARTL